MNLGEESVWEDEGYEPPSRRDSSLPSMDCWDYTIELECLKGSQDLHLAAELGKNLLERNKELENDLKQKQLTIDEQRKEIEHLTKQTAALRSTNDNRIRLSEQLEVSVQDLESANKRLTVDCASIRKEMKSLSTYKNTLEARCEELQSALEKSQEQQREKKSLERVKPEENKRFLINQTQNNETDPDILANYEKLKKQRASDQRTIADLEAKCTRNAEEVAFLEEEIILLQQKEAYAVSLKEELEESRMNNICSSCCKEMTSRKPILEVEEDDSEDNLGMQVLKSDNHFRVVVEKYETLMEERSRRRLSRDLTKSESISNNLSLQEELKLSGDFNSFHKAPELDQVKDTQQGKATPTDFSEAETSSSGFSDETSSKATQTDTNPGSFLCLIEDGSDSRFSIYDTMGPIENHFRKTPGYRSLFREIFEVLKRAAESKDDGERPPMLDDQKEPPKVPPVTPATENLPYDFECLQDSMAQSEVSSIADPEQEELACVEKDETGTKDILEYVTAARQQKKKKRSARALTPRRRDLELSDFSESAESSPMASPMRAHRRRERRADSQNASPGGTRYVTTLQRTVKGDGSLELEFRAFKSTAAQEVAKLKKLEKSYAEVLACSSPIRPSHGHAHNSHKSHPPSYGKK